MNTKKINRQNIFLAVLSGTLLTLSFPKAGLFWLAWFALVPLLVALKGLSLKDGFILGFCAGLVHYLTLVYWLANTMNTYGHLPMYLCLPALLLLSAILALYVAVFSMFVSRLCPTPFICFATTPFVWVALEYMRTLLFTGFPWELLGYSQFKVLPLIQIADMFGVYGVSFCVALGNAAFFMVFLALTKKDWQTKMVTRRLAAGSLMTFILIFGLVWFYGTWRIQAVDAVSSNAPVARIAIIQGNIDQTIKWDPAFQKASILKYINLSIQSKANRPDLVVWPETATPFYFLNNIKLSQLVIKGVQDTGADLLFGSPSFRSGKNRVEYYNSAYLIGPEPKVFGRYDKAHLVPFGEYIPLHKWLPFLNKMVEGVGDFRPGEQGQTIEWKGYNIGIQICYEIIFPKLSRLMAQNNAALLVNITNDAWYGRSSAPYQHFSMAIFRAVENRRALIRAANT
ncbi:MAG: apolipoprotein N-acyltransferase, partial [Deltaproteobacteria bacterium]|nr:apolipoprotein N-acyltransferase [Deltaproteobacteria bacterium]